MIKINLLPSKRKKALLIPPTILYGIIGLVVVIMAIIGFTYYLNKQISAKQADIYAKEQTLKKLQTALAEVKNYEKDNQEYRQKTQIIEQLKKNQVAPLRLLDEVSEMLPKGVWLTKLDDSSGIVSVEGYSFSNTDLVTYVQNLKSSKYLTDVTLVESRQAELGDFSIYKYKLTFKVKV